MKPGKDFLFTRLAIVILSLLVFGCAKLPDNAGRTTSFAIEADENSVLQQHINKVLGPDATESRYLLLGDGLDALVARAALAQQAQKSIDAQYYLVHNDEVGALFIDQLLKAADRGIRVRLLIDDIDMADRDFGTSVLDAHPNVEVRLFNPFGRNTGRLLQFITGFGEQTRRAHNKSFTVDSLATILGGRNIGNEYFVADPGMAFIDLDVLAIGPVASLVAGSFDLYWNDDLSYPISLLVDSQPTEEQNKEKTREFKRSIAEQKDSVYVKELTQSKLAMALKGYEAKMVSGKGKGHVVYDHPDKLESYSKDSDLMIKDLLPYLNNTEKELLILSPYFIPGKKGVAFFKKLRDRGVRVVILTNALSSTDVSVVHAGYAKYRRRLLMMGVELYELNRNLADISNDKEKWEFYQSKASLHAKCFVIDRRTTFIGSLNLDARSVIQNTEIGVVIESDKIAQGVASFFDNELEDLAFKLDLTPGYEGSEYIVWHGWVDGEQRTLKAEPYTSFWQRLTVGLMRILPIESQL